MKISVEWLKEYVELPDSVKQLCSDLSMAGLVVESASEAGGSPVLEIEVTSNRPDCLSHIGIAREVGAIYGKPVKPPAVRERLRLRRERIPYRIEILEPSLCPRYTGLVLTDVKVGKSPEWMERRLEAGMRPVNNVVDITNYALLEMGHPLHAFDFDLLKQGRIVVARAAEGQRMLTLDGLERQLDSGMLLINDGEGPVAIAGVMGGLHSEIGLNTRTVLLECAYFNPASVRRTSKRLGLSTEASYRFERGADWGDTVAAVARTCYLLEELAGARLAGSLQDVMPVPIEPVRIELPRAYAERLLGVPLADEFIETKLKALNFKLKKIKGAVWTVTCPSYRADMELPADLVEELARYYGYQNIPTTMPSIKTPGEHSPVTRAETPVRETLLGLGYTEAVNLSFTDERELGQFPVRGAAVPVANPLTEETGFLRSSLAAGLVRSVKQNFNHDIRAVRLFEIGRVFAAADGGIAERTCLGIVGTGAHTGTNWDNPLPGYDYFHLKGAVEVLLDRLHSGPFQVVPSPDTPWLNPANASCLTVDGVAVGVLGSLHPALEEEFKLRQRVFLAEIDFDVLQKHIFRPIQHQPLAKFPLAERDLSVVLDRGISYSEIYRGIRSLGMPELRAIDLIDVYEGEKIPEAKVSLTLRLTFGDNEKTLTVDRVQTFVDNALSFLRNSFGAERR